MQPISLEFAASDSARAVLLALREILSERVLRDDLRIGFAFDEGERAVIDVRGGNVRLEPWSRDTPVSVLTTVPTMLDLLRGDFDLDDPDPTHLFLWAGDSQVMSRLQAALSASQSLLAMRAEQAPKTKRTQR